MQVNGLVNHQQKTTIVVTWLQNVIAECVYTAPCYTEF